MYNVVCCNIVGILGASFLLSTAVYVNWRSDDASAESGGRRVATGLS
ncbi:unnamed protein product [Tenebrio molitor]|nr:unnamed protein product [Tenebrio molitor]